MFETKVLKNSLIVGNSSSLLEHSEEYRANFTKDQSICNDLVPVLKRVKDDSYSGYKAVVQAMFESGFLSTGDRDFNAEQLFNYIYGVKVNEALPAFLELHAALIEHGYNDHVGVKVPSDLYVIRETDTNEHSHLACFDCDTEYPLSHGKETGCTKCTSTTDTKTFNTSGDNFYSAYEFDHVWSDSAEIVRNMRPLREGEEELDLKAKVIIAENQSPMFAYVLFPSEFTGNPDDFYIVRLKSDYKDQDRLPELLELVKTGKFENDHSWSAYNDTTRHGIIAHLNVKEQEVKPVLQPRHIESGLFNIYCGHCCIEEMGEE